MAEPIQQIEDRAAVEELARQVVGLAAPRELPLFDPTAEAYFEDPRRSLQSARPRDEALGFGVLAAAVFITPFVLEVAKAVFQCLLKDLALAAEQDAAGRVAQLLRRMLHSEVSDDERLTQEQLARVRDAALAKARQLSLPDDQAELLATSVVGALALSR